MTVLISIPYMEETPELFSSLQMMAHGIKETLQATAELYASVVTEAGLPGAKYLLLISYLAILMAVYTLVCFLFGTNEDLAPTKCSATILDLLTTDLACPSPFPVNRNWGSWQKTPEQKA